MSRQFFDFTSESVSEGHPDKVSDRISDEIVDLYFRESIKDGMSPWDVRVAAETLTTTNKVVIAGETRGTDKITKDMIVDVTRAAIKDIGYEQDGFHWKTADVDVLLHAQSVDIAQGVDQGAGLHTEEGAGDQGIMFGYAVDETDRYMPLTLDLSHRLMRTLAALRREGDAIPYLRPDAKAQVTVAYEETPTGWVPQRIHTIVLSTQHDPFHSNEEVMLQQIQQDVQRVLIPRVVAELPEELRRYFHKDIIFHINPTGKFIIGGPHGDAGLTGRKIIVDTYGGRGAHGGGAFSGKDPSKVDRSAAYMARYVAKQLVAAGVAKQILIQLAYSIGVVAPVSIYVHTYGTARAGLTDQQIATTLSDIFDFRPGVITETLRLQSPIYEETAAYGHMGRETVQKQKVFNRLGEVKSLDVELFPWERLDRVDDVRTAFHITD